MPYQTFTYDKLRSKFDITIAQNPNLYPDVKPVPPTPLLKLWLDRYMPLLGGKSSEKRRSEMLISPILMELSEISNRKVVVFSGERFDVNRKDDLYGYCDFIVSKNPLVVQIEAPIIAIAEAKKEDLNAGTPQCIAGMVAAQRFNAQRDQPMPKIYGCVSSGTDWRFLELEDKIVTLDLREYPITELPQILGILTFMAS